MAPSAKETVVAGISGGVDSAVAALRLLEAGYAVHGLHMTNWDEDDAYCTAADDFQAARRACEDLGIPLHRVNFAREYREQVFADFLAEYRAGHTPNPDVACNRRIKFGAFLDYAGRLGADRIATGHYARLDHRDDGPHLLKANDPGKDQSYFLHAVRADALKQTLFPLGELNKSEVRRIANDAGLANYARRDSTGICFIGERPFREFLQQYLPAQPGAMVTADGEQVGEHIGLMFYTLGQRRGLHIGGIAGHPDEPWYVADKDLANNRLVVVQGHDHPLLQYAGLAAAGLRWISGNAPAHEFRCGVRTRYRQSDATALVRIRADGSAAVRFDVPQWAVTPGQYAVFYRGDECLGGGAIAVAERADASAAGAQAVSA